MKVEAPHEQGSERASAAIVRKGGAARAYAPSVKRAPRTTDEWIADLRSRGAEQTAALADLRAYLLRALPGSLDRRGGLPLELIEDVVQDTLIRVLDRLGDFEGRSRFTTWTTTIAARIAMTELRRKRWKDVSLDDLTADGMRPSHSTVDPGRDPEEATARNRIVRRLLELVDSDLSERQRTAIVAELGGMPQEEIGRRLGISRNAVYKLGHDARRKLQLGLEASGFDAAAIRAAFMQER